ncbi:MAG: TolC family protein [Bdellovibrionaceae bacterium]|nr:TolC family protein [Pseudobdellovibrionaceae bacterium]
MKVLLFIAFALITCTQAQAQLKDLIQAALERSPDLAAARSESEVQALSVKSAKQSKYIPQVSFGASSGHLHFDRSQTDANGNEVSNDGRTSSVSAAASFDLQKLFGPEAEIAAQSQKASELQTEITRRGIVRDVKKAYFSIVEIQNEITAFRAALDKFGRVSGVLDREKSVGVDTRLSRGQFQVQRDLVEADLLVRTADLDLAYAQLAAILAEPVDETIKRFSNAAEPGELQFASVVARKEEVLGDPLLIKVLQADAELASSEAEGYLSVPLPIVYAKIQRDHSTVFTSDGPQTLMEAGISLPLDGFVTRRTQKSLLNAKAQRASFTVNRRVLDYNNQVRLQSAQLQRSIDASKGFEAAEQASRTLLDQAFRFYAQKRLDAIGTTDLFQKHLQAVRNRLANRLVMQSADAELEYLTGGARK